MKKSFAARGADVPWITLPFASSPCGSCVSGKWSEVHKLEIRIKLGRINREVTAVANISLASDRRWSRGNPRQSRSRPRKAYRVLPSLRRIFDIAISRPSPAATAVSRLADALFIFMNYVRASPWINGGNDKKFHDYIISGSTMRCALSSITSSGQSPPGYPRCNYQANAWSISSSECLKWLRRPVVSTPSRECHRILSTRTRQRWSKYYFLDGESFIVRHVRWLIHRFHFRLKKTWYLLLMAFSRSY